MSLSGDKGVAQFKKSVKMGHPTVQVQETNMRFEEKFVFFFFIY